MVLTKLRDLRRRSKRLEPTESPAPGSEEPGFTNDTSQPANLLGVSTIDPVKRTFRADWSRGNGWVRPECRICEDLRDDAMPIRFTYSESDNSAYRGCASCELLYKLCEPYAEELAKFRLNAATVRRFEKNLLLSFDRYGKGSSSIELQIHAVRGNLNSVLYSCDIYRLISRLHRHKMSMAGDRALSTEAGGRGSSCCSSVDKQQAQYVQ